MAIPTSWRRTDDTIPVPTDDTTEPDNTTTDDTTAEDTGPNVVQAAIDMYRPAIVPWLAADVMVALGGIASIDIRMALVTIPAGAAAAAIAYARTKDRGHRDAEDHHRIVPGQLVGKHTTRINTAAARAAALTGACGVWLTLVALTAPLPAPAAVVTWIVWWVGGVGPWLLWAKGRWDHAERRRLRLPTHDHSAGQDEPAYQRTTVEDTVKLPARPDQPVTPDAADTPAGGYQLPDVELEPAIKAPAVGVDLDRQVAALQALLDRRKVSARVVGHQRGPTITRFGIELLDDGLVEHVTKLKTNIAYALKVAIESVRIEAPVGGQSLIGVEVPNTARDTVSLGQVLAGRSPRAAAVTVALGVTAIDALPYLISLAAADRAHMVVAGASGGGKSGALNAIICSLLLHYTADEIGMIFIDPKRVELTQYRGIPHLVFDVVTKLKNAVDVLTWLVEEMDCRYDDLEAAGVRNIDEWNEAVTSGAYTTPPGSRRVAERQRHLVLVVDELADLMLAVKEDVEPLLERLGALGRAAGVHLILATQDPRAEVLTGLIKSNIPCRLAFACATLQASQIILGKPGAEKLLGRGDALLRTGDKVALERLQSPWISTKDIAKIVAFLREQATAAGRSPMPLPVLSTTSDTDDDTNPNPGAHTTGADDRTAAEIIMDAARTVLPPVWDKETCVAATPGISAFARSKALTQLTCDPVQLYRHGKGRYSLTPPTTTE